MVIKFCLLASFSFRLCCCSPASTGGSLAVSRELHCFPRFHSRHHAPTHPLTSPRPDAPTRVTTPRLQLFIVLYGGFTAVKTGTQRKMTVCLNSWITGAWRLVVGHSLPRVGMSLGPTRKLCEVKENAALLCFLAEYGLEKWA